MTKCSKLAQKQYKSRYDWVGKVINWELCKRLKFDDSNEYYMHKPESTVENVTHKILEDFEIQMDQLDKAKPRIYPYLPNPSARAGYDTRSIFKQSLTGLNLEFSFS